MSFLKNLSDKFGDMMKDKDKDESHGGSYSNEQSRGYGDHGSSGYPPQHYGSSGDYYGGQQQHGYGAGPPPPGPPSEPQLPPGWTKQWDGNAQRFYYIDPATGRSQWEPPAMYGYGGPPSGAPPPSGSSGYGSHEQSRGHDGGQAGYGAPGYGTPHGGSGYGGPLGAAPGGYSSHYEEHRGHDGSKYKYKEEKKDGKGGMIAAGLGGAALGAIGGAVVAHEMTENSDDEGHHVQSTTYVQPAADPYAAPPPGYGAPPPADPYAAPELASDASGSDVEELQDKREDVQDAERELAEASSESDRESAREELEEAQEEYEEQYEETYDD